MTTKKNTAGEDLIKPVRLPLVLNRKNIDPQREEIPVIKNRYRKKNFNSVRGFFSNQNMQSPSNQLYKMENDENMDEALREKRRTDELEIVKTWLKHKRMECKSLNNIINKYRDDSGKYKNSVQKLPFTIKSLHWKPQWYYTSYASSDIMITYKYVSWFFCSPVPRCTCRARLAASVPLFCPALFSRVKLSGLGTFPAPFGSISPPQSSTVFFAHLFTLFVSSALLHASSITTFFLSKAFLRVLLPLFAF